MLNLIHASATNLLALTTKNNQTLYLVCLHVFLHVGLLGKGSATDDALKRFLSCVTGGKKKKVTSDNFSCGLNRIIFFMASDSPSNMLLKVKVLGEDFVTVITLKLWTFSFQLLC